MLAANDALSRTIGTPMMHRLAASGADYGVTDCPTCQMQMEHLGGHPIRHPVEIVCQAIHSSEAETCHQA
jgi:Fe-S oxidoreductase